jgi:hypothetical protein
MRLRPAHPARRPKPCADPCAAQGFCFFSKIAALTAANRLQPSLLRDHLLEDGYDIRTVQELLGCQDIRTTMVYARILNRGWGAVRSPADTVLRPLGARARAPGARAR